MSQTCSNCHATLQDSETFCRNCGTLTGLGGPDPTLIIRRPGPDTNSPWAKVGAQFATNPGRATTAGAPVTVGSFVKQGPATETQVPVNGLYHADRTRAPIDADGDAERTRIVRKQQGLPMLKGWLVAISGPEQGECWTIRHGKNSIGRTHGVDILLHEDSVSSSHAVLWLGEKDGATLVDRDSSNGTFVDGRQVFHSTEIPDDALIRCGEITTLQWVRFQPKKIG